MCSGSAYMCPWKRRAGPAGAGAHGGYRGAWRSRRLQPAGDGAALLAEQRPRARPARGLAAGGGQEQGGRARGLLFVDLSSCLFLGKSVVHRRWLEGAGWEGGSTIGAGGGRQQGPRPRAVGRARHACAACCCVGLSFGGLWSRWVVRRRGEASHESWRRHMRRGPG